MFGQALDPRFISSISLIDGALPAEYGLRTAGIIDITTKSGIQAPGGSVSVYGGSHGEIRAELRLWRRLRGLQLLRHRRFSAQ